MLGLSSGVVGFIVALCVRAVREIVRPAAVFRRVVAKKFAQRTQNTPISVFLGMLGEYFAEMLLEGPSWASFFVEEPTEGLCWASFSR